MRRGSAKGGAAELTRMWGFVMASADGSYEVLEVVSEEHPEGQLVRSFASEEEIPGVLSAFVDGNDYTMQLITTAPHKYTMQYKGSHFTVSMMTPRQAELNALMPVPPKIDTSKLVQSPMPGLVVSIAVKPGDKVVAGQEVCVVEAMKMQNALRSAVDGVVKTIKVRVGENVAADQLLVEYE
jgi:propionyl-CoA carboxylase alpha chain